MIQNVPPSRRLDLRMLSGIGSGFGVSARGESAMSALLPFDVSSTLIVEHECFLKREQVFPKIREKKRDVKLDPSRCVHERQTEVARLNKPNRLLDCHHSLPPSKSVHERYPLDDLDLHPVPRAAPERLVERLQRNERAHNPPEDREDARAEQRILSAERRAGNCFQSPGMSNPSSTVAIASLQSSSSSRSRASGSNATIPLNETWSTGAFFGSTIRVSRLPATLRSGNAPFSCTL